MDRLTSILEVHRHGAVLIFFVASIMMDFVPITTMEFPNGIRQSGSQYA
jgi:hypothetical protein